MKKLYFSVLLASVILGPIIAAKAQSLLVHVDGQYFDVTTFTGYARGSQDIFEAQAIWNNQQLAADVALAVGDQLGDPNGTFPLSGNFPISPVYVYDLVSVDPSFEDFNESYTTVPPSSDSTGGYLQDGAIQPDQLWEFADVTYASIPDSGSWATDAFLVSSFVLLGARYSRRSKAAVA